MMDTNQAARDAVSAQADGGIGVETWIGLALVCAAIVICVAYETRRRMAGDRPVDSATPATVIGTPVGASETVICFAALVRVPDVSGLDPSPERAADLFSDAKMHWAGPIKAWNELAGRMALCSDKGSPVLAGGGDVIVTYAGFLEKETVPDDRIMMLGCLRRLAEAGRLTFHQSYIRPRSLNPSQFGFS